MREIKHKWIDDPIQLDRQKVNVLVLENQKFFREFILGIQTQIELDEEFVICTDGLEPFSLSKTAFLMTDLFEIPIDDKKCATLLYKDIEKRANESNRLELAKLNSAISSFVYNLIADYSIPITYQQEFDIASILKLASIKPDYEAIGDFLVSLIDRIRILSILFRKNIFFLVNLHDVLSVEEIDIFYREMALLDIDIVVIDAREPRYQKADERVIIIDSDLCEILKS